MQTDSGHSPRAAAPGARLDVGAHRRGLEARLQHDPHVRHLLPALETAEPGRLAASTAARRLLKHTSHEPRTRSGVTGTHGDLHARHPRTTRKQARRGPPGRRREAHRRPARQGQADRARTDRTAAGRRHVRRMGHVRRAPLHRLRHGRAEDPGRRRGHRLRHDQWPAGLRLLPGLHGVRRRAVGAARREDLQDHGPGDEGRRAGDRPERLRRRAHPGRRGLAGRLCRHLPAQRDGLGRDPADQRDHGPVRGRRGLFAGHHRLHLHGEGHLLHVRDRARRGEDGDPRGSHGRGTGRRIAYTRQSASPTSPSRTTWRRC